MKKRNLSILVLVLVLSLLIPSSVMAKEVEKNPAPCQDISKNITTGEIAINDISNFLTKSENTYTDSYIPKEVAPTVEFTPEAIIGDDNRTQVTNTTTFPNSAIAYIEIKFPNTNTLYIGTAWMYGNSVAMTAGHCVYDADLGGWAEWIRIYPGRNGESTPFDVYYASVLHTDTKYVESENSNYDWGLLEFSQNIGSRTGYFGASWTTSSLVGTGIVLRGYPGEKSAQMWTMSGSIAASGTYKLAYYIDTTGGQSGSPVYENDGNYRCLGIHTNYNSLGFNQAERIDESLFNIMNQYR